MALRRALLLSVVAISALAVPFDYGNQAATCATSCPGSTKFQWNVGKTYEYLYESDMKTQIAGASNDHSSLHIRAKASIEVIAPCEMALRVSDVSLEESSQAKDGSRGEVTGSTEFKRALERRPLRFGFLDGRIDTVCPEQGDETWVVNLKRGIVSAFQNTQSKLDASITTVEVDIAGTCPVEYEVEASSWGTKTIKKTKDLLGCTERTGHFTAFQSTPYSVDSAIQTMPLMKSTHECRQQIKNGIIRESTCSELHVFRPFSRGNNGAVTEVYYKLSLNKESAGVSTTQGPITMKSSLLFEHVINTEEMAATVRDAKQSLQELCRKTQDEIGTEAPRLFRELVQRMRHLDSRALQTFYRSAPGTCDKASKFVRDAIPVIGSPASLVLIRDLIMAGDVNNADADTWITSMGFVANPTRNMLAEVKPLLEYNQYLRKSVLSISTMVYRYCRHNRNCDTEPEVDGIIRILEDNLRYNCKAQSNGQHDLILMSLKAIGNTGHATRAVSTINRCFRNQDISVEIRIAALQAFRRMACAVEMNEVKEILASDLEDSELRVQAYLTLMQCPGQVMIQYVEQVLAKEEVNQVGSFIWTHLTNLMETANPHKRDIRRILENVNLQKKFDLDKRKFSRNIEWSAFSNLINVGATAESNLIWSEKSFIPRSAALNLSVEMFGESVNLLEIGGRVQGLEKTLEKVFAQQDNEMERRKRSTDEIAVMDRKYDQQRDVAQASYYVRVFGNEISYDDFHNFDLATIKDKMNYIDWITELSKEHNFDMTKTMMFLDASMVVPTAAGLPLRLSVDGTYSVTVSVSGKLDIRQLLTSQSTFDIDGSVKPSGSMEINGEIGIDARVARTGIKMKTTLHTNTVAEGKIQMKNGRIFKLDIKSPEENTQIISADNKFFIIYRGQEKEQKMVAAKRMTKNACTSGIFETATGLQLCAQLSLPWTDDKENMPMSMLCGPASARLIVNKRDSHSRYILEANYIREKIGDAVAAADNIRFHMDTPGSRINRKWLIELTLDQNGKRLSLDLNTPWKVASFGGKLTNTAKLKQFLVTATLDGKDAYLLSAEMGIDKKSYISQYIPKVEIRIPGSERILFSGDIKHRPGKKSIFSMILRNAFEEPVKASGSIITVNEPNQMRYETELELSSYLINGKMIAFVDNTKDKANSVSSKLDLEYTMRNQPAQKIEFEHNFIDSSSYDTHSYTLDSSWATTLAEHYNGDIHLDFEMNGESMSTSINGGFDQSRRIKLTEMATFIFDRQQKLDVDMTLLFPYMDMDYTGKISYLRNNDELKVSGAAKCCVDKEGSFSVIAKRYSSKPLNVMTEATLAYPGRDIALSGSVEEITAGVYHQNLNIQIQKYKNVLVNSVLKTGPRYELSTDISTPHFPKVTIKGHLQPDLRNLQAHGEVSHESKTYMADVNWMYRGKGKNVNGEGNVEVAYPGSHILIQGSASRQGSEILSNIETKWDAANNDQKKFSMTSKFNIDASNPDAEVKINVYPKHFINLKMNGNYETGGWYKSDSDVEGSFSLQSSYAGFEDIAASFHHDRTPRGYKNSGEISWENDQKIAGLLNIKKRGSWANSQIDAEVTTPFIGARRIKTELGYNIQDKMLTANAKTQLENNQITLDFNGELNIPQHKLSGDMTFASSHPGLRSLTANIRHKDDGHKFESSMATSWAPDKTIAVNFNMEHEGTIFDVQNNGKLSIMTPFAGYGQAKTIWRHIHNSNKLENAAQVELDGQSVYSHSTILNMKRTGRKFLATMRGSMKLAGMQEVMLSLDHSHDRVNFERANSVFSVTWAPEKTLLLSYDIDVSGDKLLWLSGRIETPFDGFESLTLQTNTNQNLNTILSSNEIKWGVDQKIDFESEATIHGYEFEIRSQLSTPFRGIRKVIINAENHRQNDIWVTHADFDYGKRIELDTEFGMSSMKMISLHIKSPCPYVKDMYAKAEVIGVLRNFKYNIEIRHDQLADKIKINGMANTADIKNVEIAINMKTPFQVARFLKLTINEIIGKDNIHINGAIKHPYYQAEITEDISYRLGSYINTKTVIAYMEDKQIEIATEVRIKPTISAYISWKSPFENYREIKLVLSHETSLSGFSTNGELTYGPRVSITGNLNYYTTDTTIGGTLQLATPFQPMKHVAAVISHEGTLTDFKNDATFELNKIRISGKSLVSIDRDTANMMVELQTPFEGYETITAEISHRGPITNFRNNIRLTIGTKELVGTGQFRIRRSSVAGSLELQLPFAELYSVAIILDQSGSISDFNNKFVLAYNNKKILAKSNFKLSGTSVNGKISVKTPFKNLRSMAMIIRHEGPFDDFKNDIVVSLNDKELTAESQLLLSGSTLAATGNIALPNHVGYLQISHEGPVTNFHNAAVMRYNGASYMGESQFRNGENALNGKVTYSYPSRTMSAAFNHRGKLTNFNNDVTLMFGEKQLDGNSKFKLNGNGMTAEGSLKFPDNSYAVAISHEGPLDNFKNNFQLQYNRNQVEGKSELSLSGGDLGLKASVSTPYSVIKSASVDFEHSGPLSNFNNNAAFIFNNRKFTGNSQFSLSGDRLNAKTAFDGPKTRIAGEINHNGKLTNFKNDVRFAYNGKEMTGNGEFGWRGNNLNLKGKVTVPGNTISADFYHSGSWNNFNNNGAFVYNGKTISAMSAFNRSGDNLNGKLSVDSPSKRLAIDVGHRGPINNFESHGTLAYGKQIIVGKAELKLLANRLSGKAGLELPSDTIPSLLLEVNHEGPMDNFRNDFSVIYGQQAIRGNGEFKNRNNRLYAMGELKLPTSGAKHIVAELTHSGKRTNFENTLQMTVDEDNIKSGSRFSLQDGKMNAAVNFHTTYNLKPISVEISHNGPISNFVEKAVFSYGDKRLTAESEFHFEGDVVECKVKIEPSFCCLDPIAVDIMYRGPLNSLSCRASAKYGNYEVVTSNDLIIRTNALHLKSELKSNIGHMKPLTVEVNHEGLLMDFNNNAIISYGSESVSGQSEFKLSGSTLYLKSTIQTSFSGLKPISLEINHSGSIGEFQDSVIMSYGNKEIKSSFEFNRDGNRLTAEVELATPFSQVKELTAKFNHNGRSWHNFENSGIMKLNNKRYTGQSEFRWFGKIFKLYAETKVPNEYSFKVSHKGISTDFSNNMKIQIPGERMSGTSSFKAIGSKIEGRANLDSTIGKLANIEGSFFHEGAPSKFKTSFNLRTPFTEYKSFSGEINHEGPINHFQTTGSLNMPFKNLRHLEINANHQHGRNKLNTATSVSYNDKAISGAIRYEKEAHKVRADVSVQTPYPTYENFAASMEHSGTGNNFKTNGGITTSIPGYKKFTGMLNHQGDIKEFNTVAEVTTPFRKYNKFGINIKHSGNRSNFRTSGSLETPIPGYEILSASLNHNGNWRAFTTTGQFQTPIRGHEVYTMTVNHDSGSGISTSATLEYPGKKYNFRLNHQGTTKNFNTDINIHTPHNGYKQFGLSVAHQGDLSDMTQTGTIRLPIWTTPEIKYRISHKGGVKGFTSSGSVEYGKRKVEGNCNFKHTSGYGEDNYDGGFSIKATQGPVRHFQLKAKHTIKPSQISGMLDISHNGQKAVDLDYDYSTLAEKSIDIKIRKPEAVETKVKYQNDGERLIGGGYINWDNKFNGSGEVILKYLPNDRELNFKMVLPSRTVTLKSGYTNTGSGIRHSTDFQWGNDVTKKLSYDLEGSMTNHRRRTIIDGRLNLKSSRISGEATLNHVRVPGRQYTTEVALQTNRRMSIKSDLTIVDPKFQHVITIEHPAMIEGVTLKFGGLMDNKVYDGKVELQYNGEIITFIGRVADASSPTSYRYESSCRLTHPGSELDFQYTGTLINNPDISSWSMQTKYLFNPDRVYRTSSLKVEYDKTRKEAVLEVINPLYGDPVYTLRVSGRQTYSNGILRYDGEASIDQSAIRGELTVTGYKSADLVIYYNNEDFLRATAKMTSQQLKAEIFRMASGSKIQESLFLLKKDPERMVSSRMYWRPDIMRDLKTALKRTSFGRQLSLEWNKFINLVMEDWHMKADYVRINAEPVYRTIVSAKNTIWSVIREIQVELNSIYEKNEFYLKDISNWLIKMNRYVKSTYATLKSSAEMNYTRAGAAVSRGRRSVDTIVEQTWTYTEGLGSRIADWWSQLVDTVNCTTRDLADRVTNIPGVQTIMDTITDTSYYPTWNGDEDGAAAATSYSPSRWNQLINRDDIQTGIVYIKKKILESEVVNKYFELKKITDDIVADIRQHGLQTIRANVVAWLKDYMKPERDSFTFGNGEVKLSLYVPLPLDDLNTVPTVDINFSKYIKQARDVYKNYMPKYDWTLWDYYYTYKPSTNFRDMMPPFRAHAAISGNQHYMTFDKRFYEFAGECNYLLARDFIDGTFSVIVNYDKTGDRPVRKSLTVMSKDKTIVISMDGTVMMDNARVEMPLELDDITILREQNRIIVNNKRGVTIACDLAHNQCSVEVSGWYYGKTAGLMGTYNNEQVDDFTTIDKERLHNAGQFAASWSLGARCKPINYAAEAGNEVVPEPSGYPVCAQFFVNENSPFRKCFRVVNPEPFMKMCLSDMLINSDRVISEEDTCNTAAFYISECQRVGVPVKISSVCVRCQMEDGRIFSEGQNVTIRSEEVPHSADFVFIIQYGECNKKMLESVKNVVVNLENILVGEGLQNNRYSIIGYGGQGITSAAHIHTIGGQVFATAKTFSLGIANFKAKSGNKNDAMAAVKYATNLPFRVGVSKNILLLPCDTCRQGQATFSELQQLLLFRDISLHILMPYNFMFKNKRNTDATLIFGVDRETVYTRKDAGTAELVGDSEIRPQILMPKDLCVALSEETDGSVFNTLQYTDTRPYIQKRFMDVLVRVIADKAEPSDCQICDCKPDQVGAGKADCRHCVRPNPIYDVLPNFETSGLRSPFYETLEISEPSVANPTDISPKKSTPKKSKKQLNGRKRTTRKRRLERSDGQ